MKTLNFIPDESLSDVVGGKKHHHHHRHHAHHRHHKHCGSTSYNCGVTSRKCDGARSLCN